MLVRTPTSDPIRNREASTGHRCLAFLSEGAHRAASDLERQTAMPAKKNDSGFSDEERAAMKERAAELRAEGKKGAKKADGLQAVLDSIAQRAPEDRALPE